MSAVLLSLLEQSFITLTKTFSHWFAYFAPEMPNLRQFTPTAQKKYVLLREFVVVTKDIRTYVHVGEICISILFTLLSGQKKISANERMKKIREKQTSRMNTNQSKLN